MYEMRCCGSGCLLKHSGCLVKHAHTAAVRCCGAAAGMKSECYVDIGTVLCPNIYSDSVQESETTIPYSKFTVAPLADGKNPDSHLTLYFQGF